VERRVGIIERADYHLVGIEPMQSMAVLSALMFSIPMSVEFKMHCLGLKTKTRSFPHPSKEGCTTISQPSITYLDQHIIVSKQPLGAISVYAKEKVTLQV